MPTLRFVALLLFIALVARGEDWRLALPGWRYEFPRDHRPHPAFKTEWWYFTGNLRDATGRRFGYQLTFFRQGIRPPGARGDTKSQLIVNELPFAHFTLTDLESKQFLFQQKISRGAFGQAGFDAPQSASGAQRLAWIDEWRLDLAEPDRFQMTAATGDVSLHLSCSPAKPWAIHGQNGISQKAEGEGRASHYYSGTRMVTTGEVTLRGKRFDVTGESWFDHEWASNQLTPEQAGWNWFSIQLDDGSELMLYQMRLRNGGTDPESSGTSVDPTGETQHLKRDDYQLKPLDFWTSTRTRARYPIAWEVSVPGVGLTLTVRTPLAAQELAFAGVAYWEGMIEVAGQKNGKPVRGRGYMELTGYAGPLVGLSAPQSAGPSDRK